MPDVVDDLVVGTVVRRGIDIVDVDDIDVADRCPGSVPGSVRVASDMDGHLLARFVVGAGGSKSLSGAVDGSSAQPNIEPTAMAPPTTINSVW